MSWEKWDAERALRGDDVHRSLISSRPRLDSEQAQRVRYHTGDGFSQTNRRLREATQSESDKRTTDAMDRIIGKSVAQHDMVLLHGRQNLHDVKEGDEIHEPGYLSTTTDSSMAKNYAGASPSSAILRVRLKQGEQALSTHGLSDNPHEREVMLPRGQYYRVIKVQQAPGQFGLPVRLVDVEVVHHEGMTPTTSSSRVIANRVAGGQT